MGKRLTAINTFLSYEVNFRVRAVNGLLFLAYLFFTAYVFWEYYWYTRVSWMFVKWHTHLAPYLFFLTLLFTAAVLKKRFTDKLLLLTTICLSLLLIETFLTFLYPSLYAKFNYDLKNYYHIWAPNEVHHLQSEEFDFKRMANSLGFSGPEWPKEKGAAKRVITLGDSFTEGDGAAEDSSYPVLLQQILNNSGDSAQWEILNAGVCGSDPVFGYQNLKDRLLIYKPDVVIQAISSHDFINDIALRGGFERFKPNGTLKPKTLPAWFYPAVFSNISWWILDVTGITGIDWAPIEQTERDIADRYSALADANNFKVILILMPLYWEMEKGGTYQMSFTPFLQAAAKHKNLTVVDLMPCYSQAVKDYDGVKNLYWVKNYHHNSTGYGMMAKCIANAVK